MQPDYEIILGRGIGAIIFGLSKKQLTGLLGEPDETYDPDDPERPGWETFGYDSINCSFSFDPEQGDRLVEISVENGYFHVGHKIRVGMKKEELQKLWPEFQFGEYVIHDMQDEEFPTHELISYDPSGLNLWLDDGRISAIRVSPLFTKENRVVWPEQD